MELSKIIAGNLLLIMVLAGFFIFFTEGVRVYAPTAVPTGYNSSFVRIQNHISNITDIANRTETALKVKSPTSGGIIDFIGFFFSAGYQGLGVAVETVKLNYDIADMASDSIAGGTEYGNTLKAVTMLLILMMILVAIIMSIIFKWQT